MSNISWTPSEPSDVLFSEKTWLQGAILTGVGYGVVFTLFTQCFRALLLSINQANRTQQIFFLVYISILFILGTLFMAACAQMTQLSFVQYRDYPTGPSGYENDEFSIPVDELGNVSFVLTNWFADALLVCPLYFEHKYTVLTTRAIGMALFGHLPRDWDHNLVTSVIADPGLSRGAWYALPTYLSISVGRIFILL